MSGAKRRTPFRKQVTDSVLHEFPEPGPSQRIAIVLRGHGTNLLEVAAAVPHADTDAAAPPAVGGSGGEDAGVAAGTWRDIPDTVVGMAMLPTKFRKLVWVKRGDPVIVTEAAGEFETAAGSAGGVRFLVDHVLYEPQVAHLRKVGVWPAQLDAVIAAAVVTGAPAGAHSAASGGHGKPSKLGGGGVASVGKLTAQRGAGGGATAALAARLARGATGEGEGEGEDGEVGGVEERKD